MTALETIDKIIDSNLYFADLRYCLVDESKHPYKNDHELASPNKVEDFVNLSDLLQYDLQNYAGVGISIQASNVFGIDVDDCFSRPFDITSADQRAHDILDRFKDIAYCEFSFSGKGLRIFFKMSLIDHYTEKYYIKNSKKEIEFYQPSTSFRYVTVTGRYICNNQICNIDQHHDIIFRFLDDYMTRPKKQHHISKTDDRSIEQLMLKTKYLYLTNSLFQNLWFSKAPGSGKNESEKDFQLIALIFENITSDQEKVRLIFEQSSYFKSKDQKHLNKWNYGNYRYYHYIFEHL